MAILEALQSFISPHTSSSAPSSPAALQEASIWQASAGTWASRLTGQYEAYLDVVQPVHLAVQEARHGLALLSAAAVMSAPDVSSSTVALGGALMALPPRMQDLALLSVSALLSFPAHLSPTSSTGGSPAAVSASSLLPAVLLGDESALQLVQSLAAAAARASAPSHLDPSTLARIGEAASYSARLQALRLAMHAAARELLVAGGPAGSPLRPAASETTFAAGGSETGVLGHGDLQRLERLWALLHASWQQLRAYEEARAEEEAEVYKNKNRSTTIKSQEVRGGVREVGIGGGGGGVLSVSTSAWPACRQPIPLKLHLPVVKICIYVFCVATLSP